jgi:hypothetical protein
MAIKLSRQMRKAVDKARDHGGLLIRRPGGYWTYENCPGEKGVPEWYITLPTVRALVDRGVMIFSEHHQRDGYPIQARLVDPGRLVPHHGSGP